MIQRYHFDYTVIYLLLTHSFVGWMQLSYQMDSFITDQILVSKLIAVNIFCLVLVELSLKSKLESDSLTSNLEAV